MALTKREIARAIHTSEPAISVGEAIALVDEIFEAMKARLARGEKVMITNFGTFEVVDRATRRGVNPATGERMDIGAHRAVTFQPAPAMRTVLGEPDD